MKVLFGCPSCGYVAGVGFTGSLSWTCPRCDHAATLTERARATAEPATIVENCSVCGNHELYRMKGFPHWLGMSILVFACLAFLILQGRYNPYWAWGVLLGSAAFDGLLYLAVPDVVTCYRCRARHRGMRRAANEPFELTIYERYRHEEAQTGQKTEPQ